MKKILLIFGTRPEAIKLCPLILALQKYRDQFKTVVCVTGQHREMLDQILTLFEVSPDYDFNIMTNNQTLFDITSNALTHIGNVLENEKPDIGIVQGDTTTTLAASLAAYYTKVKLGHVEAGLRTKDKYSPYPEELNRKLTSAIADIHFAPTEVAKNNLLEEGARSNDIFVTGNTVIDALLWIKKKILNENKVFQELSNIDFGKKIILVTGHRRENFGKDLKNICEALKHVAVDNKNVELVYPVHLNPNVRGPVFDILGGIHNVKLIDPLGYEQFIYLADKSYFIISDSGGIQEEAPTLGKPVLVTRKVTERPEAVRAGAVKLVGANKTMIVAETLKLLDDSATYNQMSKVKNPYGDGRACERIIDAIRKFFLKEK